jgi:hypothetical protein
MHNCDGTPRARNNNLHDDAMNPKPVYTLDLTMWGDIHKMEVYEFNTQMCGSRTTDTYSSAESEPRNGEKASIP